MYITYYITTFHAVYLTYSILNIISCILLNISNTESWLVAVWLADPGHQVQVLLWLAEVVGQVVHAQVLVLAGVEPGSVLLRVRNPVQEDPKRFPNGLLANWTHTNTDTLHCYFIIQMHVSVLCIFLKDACGLRLRTLGIEHGTFELGV